MSIRPILLVVSIVSLSFSTLLAFSHDSLGVATEPEIGVAPTPELPASDDYFFFLWNLGVKGGWSSSNFRLYRNIDYRGTFKGDNGYDIGAFVEATFAEKKLSFQIEGMYSFSQVHAEQVVDDDVKKIDIELKMLRFPVNVKYTLTQGKIAPFIAAGPNIGVALEKKGSLLNNGQQHWEKMPISGMLIGMQAGTGINFQIARKVQLQTEVRWMLTNLNIQDRMNHIQLSMGVRFLEWF